MTKKEIITKVKNIKGLNNAVIEFSEKPIYRYLVKIHTGGYYLDGEVLQRLKTEFDNIGTPDIYSNKKTEITIIFNMKDYS